MGGILMITNPFKKENRVYYTLSDEAKKNRNIYYLISIIIFVINAFTMYEVIFNLSSLIGSIACSSLNQGMMLIFRMLPLIILNFALVHLNIYLRKAYKYGNSLKINSIASMALGTISILYILIGLIIDEYHYLVEGYPSPLFPLDVLLLGAILVGFGFVLFKYSSKVKEEAVKQKSFVNTALNVFKVIGYMIVLTAFAMACYAPFVLDFTKDGIFYNIMLSLVIWMAVLGLIYKVFIIDEATNICKEKIAFISYLGILVINVLVFGLYIVSVNVAPHAPNMNSFGLLPIDYTASINIFFIVFFLNNIIGSIVNLGLNFKYRKYLLG